MSLEPGRAAAIPASHRAPRGRRRSGPGRPETIQAVLGGRAIRAGQILGDVTPVGAAATPPREMRAVTDGIRDFPPPGAAAIQDPARRPAGCLPQRGPGRMGPSQGRTGGMGPSQGGSGGMGPPQEGSGGMGPPQEGSGGMGPPGRNSGGFRVVVPPGQHSRATPAGGGILLGRGVRDSGARCRAASGSASSSPARPSAPSPLW
jgi:hypothetical protein